jgi:phage-related protein
MADAKFNVIVSIADQFSKGLDSIKTKLQGMESTFQNMTKVGAAGFTAITGVVGLSVASFGEAERSQRQLEHAIIQVSKGTMQQVDAISAASDALQRKSGIDGDALKMGLAQLSTFGLQSESVVNLTKALADLTVNQNGVNASADQYVSSANVIAKALNGQFGALEKSGIRFTDAQQKMILYGKESEKVAALQEGLAQNLRETTDTLSGVDAASAKVTRSFGEIFESIGSAMAPAFTQLSSSLIPVIEAINQWVADNQALIPVIVQVGLAISALLVGVGTLGLLIPKIITAFQNLRTVFTFIAAHPIILAIGALIAIGVLLYQNWEVVGVKAQEIWNLILTTLTTVIEGAKAKLQEFWNEWSNVILFVGGAITGLFLPSLINMGVQFAVTMAQMAVQAVVNFAKITATFIAESATWIAQMVIASGKMIAQWVLMGVQSLIHAAKMAGAWIVAMGPVGWVTAAVVALAALIIANWDKISAWTASTWNAVSNAVAQAWSSIKEAVGAALGWISEKVSSAGESIKGAFSAMWDAVTGIFSSALAGLKSLVDSVLGGISRAINSVVSGINSAKAGIGGAVSAAGNFLSGGRAAGGPVRPGEAYLVGEKGPEILRMGSQSGNIVPNHRLGKGGSSINVTVTGNQFLDRYAAEKMGDLLIQKLRKNLIPT